MRGKSGAAGLPAHGAPVSKHLKLSASYLDGALTEIFSTVPGLMHNERPIKRSNEFVCDNKASSVIIVTGAPRFRYVSKITVRYLVPVPPVSVADNY